MKMSRGWRARPASSTRTRLDGSAESRLANAHPAEPPPTMRKSCSARRMLVTDDLRQLVPLHALPDLRTELPFEGLGARVAVLPDALGLRERIEAARRGDEIGVLAGTEPDEGVQAPRDRAPPAPVVAHDLADPCKPDRTHGVPGADLDGGQTGHDVVPVPAVA